MVTNVVFLGFGEAAQTFAGAMGWRPNARGFDIKTDDPALRSAKLSDFNRYDVRPCDTCAEAVSDGATLLSLVTADQAVHAARKAAKSLMPGSLFLDMNSVASRRKQAASHIITAAGGHYVDVAIMAPVQPKALSVPLLVSGPLADKAAVRLAELGFSDIRIVGEHVGRASSIKMIRSVMIKGIEALTAEFLIAADAAGVTDEVLASLGGDWTERADYNLERMLVHGHRRAAEMEEVCATLESLGIEPLMTRATVERQRALGNIGRGASPLGLTEKLSLIANSRKQDAE
jgi:3-hydroxyisobutyrate dehydrogenase-like beta-hydroxyacid dehydrogenase